MYAAKIMKKSALKRKRIGRTGNALQNVVNEIDVWARLDHPNIVKVWDHECHLRSRCPQACFLLTGRLGPPKCCAVRVRVQLIEVIDDADVDKLYLISQFISGRSLMKDEQASVADEPN